MGERRRESKIGDEREEKEIIRERQRNEEGCIEKQRDIEKRESD